MKGFNNIFKKKEKKNAALQLRIIEDLAQKEKVIKTYVNHGLISYNPLTHRLFIATSLAAVYLQNAERWSAFLHNIHNWALYHRQQEAWNAYFQEVEIKAVREAKKKYASLSRAEIQRIRQEARMKVDISAIDAPKAEAFEYFIGDIESDDVNIHVVGNYDGTDFEMADYASVLRFCKAED